MENIVFLSIFCAVGVFLVSVYAAIEANVEFLREQKYIHDFIKNECAEERRELEQYRRDCIELARYEYQESNVQSRFFLVNMFNEKKYVKARVNSLVINSQRALDRRERKCRKIAKESYIEYLRMCEDNE